MPSGIQVFASIRNPDAPSHPAARPRTTIRLLFGEALANGPKSGVQLTPAGRSHLARREHPPPAFVELRADHVPAIANRIFIDHAIRGTSVRLDPESRRPQSTRRTPAHRDSLIVRG